MNGLSIIFNVNDEIYYDKQEYVCQLLGIKNRARRGTTKLDARLLIENTSIEEISIWFPIMEGCKSKGWKNKLSLDGSEIISTLKKKEKNGKKKHKNSIRITFGKFKINGKEKYKFIGVFILNKVKGKKLVFKKQANSFAGISISGAKNNYYENRDIKDCINSVIHKEAINLSSRLKYHKIKK